MRLVVPYVKFATKTIQIGGKRSYSIAQSDTSAKKTKRFRYLIPLGGLLLVGLIGGLIWRSLSSPSYGQVAVISPETGPRTKLPEFTTLTTNFYSLNYSERYAQQSTDIAPAGVLDQKILSYKLGNNSGESKLDINVKAAPYGGITEDSTYMYYQKHSDQYKMSNALYRGEIVDIAKSIKGQPEETALWLHGSFLMIVKLTTDDKSQPIKTEMKDLLSSLQWRVQ